MCPRPLALRAILFLVTCVTVVSAQGPPAGYYDSVDTSTKASLRSTLNDVIDDHTRIPYSSSGTDTWVVLEKADEDPLDGTRILDVYKNGSYGKVGGGNSNYNREHTWPKSFGFPNDGSTNYPYSDCHQLFLSNSSYNSSRGNRIYRNCSVGCAEYPTDVNFGQGGGTGVYPGNSNWGSGTGASGSWETWLARRGDVARALFYLDVRYEGGAHGVTGALEPDLILTDSQALIGASNTGQNMSVAYMGLLAVLLQWHAEDPVDSLELWRNDQVFLYQGNRNPFIDNPEWVDCLFGTACSTDPDPPAAPTGLMATESLNAVLLDWDDNLEPDLLGYNVYRSTVSGGPYARVNASTVATSDYTDGAVAANTTYYYEVRALDTSTNESLASLEASATPLGGGGAGDPWINEFHYDNTSTDSGEFVEIAGPAGLNLSGWQLLGYNGNGGSVYQTVGLSGVLADQGGCIGTKSFPFLGLQNGSPDGMALVSPLGVVVEFLSYEGVVNATSGPAAGTLSTDVGVSETGSTPVGFSLQRGGSGSNAGAFSWQTIQLETPDQPNQNQTFEGGCPALPPLAPAGLAATGGDGEVGLSWLANGESDVIGYDVYRSPVRNGEFSRITPSLVGTPDYTDFDVENGNVYYYAVTAWNDSGLESPLSDQAPALPLDQTPPLAPTRLHGNPTRDGIRLDWDDNLELDLAGYDVYRVLAGQSVPVKLNALPLLTSEFLDTTTKPRSTYFYGILAVDQAGNFSGASNLIELEFRAKGAVTDEELRGGG